MTPKSAFLVMTLTAMVATGYQNARSQACAYPINFAIGAATASPCTLQRVSLPVSVIVSAPCSVGAFNVWITTTDPNWLRFTPGDSLAADRTGGLIEDWEHFNFYVNPAHPESIRVTGVAGNADDLGPSSGMLFTLNFNYSSYLVSDTSQEISLDSASASDPSGYYLLPTSKVDGTFYVGHSQCYGNPRGDANCNGQLNGIDVTFMVAFLKGGASYCRLCSGDANGNGEVNGLDVTYLINYFKGAGQPPGPCH